MNLPFRGTACILALEMSRPFCWSLLLLTASASSARAQAVPAWAFPAPAPSAAAPVDSVTKRHIPGSKLSFTDAQVRDLYNAADWFPKSHSAMPAPVAHGEKGRSFACAYCHLPNGIGRPENTMLAGLPADYIVQQVLDMKTGARQIAFPGKYVPSDNMRLVAQGVTPEELRAAARYYSRLPQQRRSRVVEAAEIPRPEPSLGLYVPAKNGGTEPLGERLIEMTPDPERHELRDPNAPYVAYVPVGSIKAGRALAKTGRGTIKPCASCHGPALQGAGSVPPIAGRAPSYLLRQLLAFKAGTRSAAQSAPMRDEVSGMTLGDMIAAAAYAGSLRP